MDLYKLVKSKIYKTFQIVLLYIAIIGIGILLYNVYPSIPTEDDIVDVISYCLVAIIVGIVGWVITEVIRRLVSSIYEGWVNETKWVI